MTCLFLGAQNRHSKGVTGQNLHSKGVIFLKERSPGFGRGSFTYCFYYSGVSGTHTPKLGAKHLVCFVLVVGFSTVQGD
jgi:hypothetical protein